VLRDIPVAECIPRIMSALDGVSRIKFTDLFDDVSDRSLVIATFMALLELIRRREVRAFQEARFGPIYLNAQTLQRRRTSVIFISFAGV